MRLGTLLPLLILPLLALPAARVAAQDVHGLVRFSAAKPGTTPPKGWEAQKINERKKLTQYELVDDGGTVVLHAVSSQSASGLGQHVSIDLARTPIVEWRWKVSRLIETADMTAARTEDSPARLVFAFDGDESTLPLADRAAGVIARKISGQELPFATLMYVWANEAPVDTIIRNPHTGRIRMVVAASGSAGVGAWQSLSRNLREDYRRAFGEEPGRLVNYGVLTDTDNTGESVEAWYGDIVFKAAGRER